LKFEIASRADERDVQALRAAPPEVELQVVKHQGRGNSAAVLEANPNADALYIHTRPRQSAWYGASVGG
jgi:hypothetical protein